MRYFLGLFYSISILIIISAFSNQNSGLRKSSGAPWGSTGAPMEGTCGRVGCHDQFDADFGTGSLELEFNFGKEVYAPGYTYPIKVTLTDHDTLTKFGFQWVALQKDDSTNAGTIRITNSFRTQNFDSHPNTDPALDGRKYVTHTFEGALDNKPGVGTWTFEWLAPENYTDSITFYLAALATNNNLEMIGDYVYTKTLKLSLDPSPGFMDQNPNLKKFNLYPNPASNFINIEFELAEQSIYEINIVDITGNIIWKKRMSEKSTNHNESILLPHDISPGLYFVQLDIGSFRTMHKFIIID
ncbi:T9SS type A sorting domain-containing protein [bacterium AH-315-C07]|nr:T9SS type A sorting domain-containing protein [bacterium AH-315-C07]